MVWKAENPQGNESAKIRWDIVRYTRGRGLDLGCGPYKTFGHFIGVDNHHHRTARTKPDIVCDAAKLDLFASQSMDFVFSSHLLEHIADAEGALREWWRVLKYGGHLVLYLPHKEFYPNIGEEGSNPDHKHDFIPDDIIAMMRYIHGWDLVVNEERNQDQEYSFLQVYRKTSDKQRVLSHDKVVSLKTCAVVRYGGFGDMVQTSSVLPLLKKQGYHITVYTTPRGYDIIKSDPHVDDIYLQDPDQVPNHMLGEFWAHEIKKYDKFVNLSESVEGTFLAMPDRSSYAWTKDARHLLCNFNYLEFVHSLAEVPYDFNTRFYPTPKEVKWAKSQRKKMGSRVVLWILSGSSVHKTWPYLDQAIARMLIQHPDIKIVLVGDELSRILELGWEEEPRVIRKSGRWSIRQTLSFAEQVDLIIGPETGVLNAVGILPIPKIVFLSHSTIENLSKHWVNCTSLIPEGCHCYPCHQLHYGFNPCIQDEETGVAICQTKISPDLVESSINHYLNNTDLKVSYG